MLRYRKGVSGATERGHGAALPPVKEVLNEWFKPLTDVLNEARATAALSSPQQLSRDTRAYSELLTLIDAQQMSVIVMHTMVGACLSHPQSVIFRNVCLDIANNIIAQYNYAKLRKVPKA